MKLYLKLIDSREEEKLYCGVLVSDGKRVKIDNYIAKLSDCYMKIYGIDPSNKVEPLFEICGDVEIIYSEELYHFYTEMADPQVIH